MAQVYVQTRFPRKPYVCCQPRRTVASTGCCGSPATGPRRPGPKGPARRAAPHSEPGADDGVPSAGGSGRRRTRPPQSGGAPRVAVSGCPLGQVCTAVPSIWISMPSRGMRWRCTRCLGGRLRRGLLRPALTRMRRRVVLPMSMPSRSLSNSLRWVWSGPFVLSASQTNYAGHHGIGRCVGWPAAPVTVSNGGLSNCCCPAIMSP